MAQSVADIRWSVSTASGSDRIIESWSKPLSVLARCDERLHHLGIHEVAVELIQLRQPEVIAGVIRIRSAVGIAAEVTKVLHQDKGAAELLSVQGGVLGHSPQRSRSSRHIARVCG